MKKYHWMFDGARTLTLLALGLLSAGCQTFDSKVLEKNASSNELRKETTLDPVLPSGCPTVTMSLPEGRNKMEVSYREPTLDQNGIALTTLAFTTVYVSSVQSKTTAFRIWTNDARGGALVTVRDIPVQDREAGICVTATNWGRKESAPAAAAPQTGAAASH
ncbi:protein of unknown function [Nitrospira japonica]|uniref:Lipoprotein n=1 Tax=Nitrospira japonica TaxID=1325564 RepID=A0A1W1I8T5_9BACT|nr:hypothetical protein [Nitrospira japonica]SLM49279.1 protein of unknown function [Nitrospira japonica]